jgi:hypothetical protein
MEKSLGDTDLNHGPIGLQLIALPLSYIPLCAARELNPVERMGILHDTTTPAALISETIRFICHKLYARLDKIINSWKNI